jgi:hypothetical protein
MRKIPFPVVLLAGLTTLAAFSPALAPLGMVDVVAPAH